MNASIDDRYDCVDCGRNTCIPPREFYAVHDALWSEACAVEPALPDERGMLWVSAAWNCASAASSAPPISNPAVSPGIRD